jgi:putative transposase
MPYWRLFYHAIWATWYREPLVSREVEPVVHDLLRGKAIGLGATVFALNGMEDHVHMVISVPPKLALSDFLGKVKGATSTNFNRMGLLDRPLKWQEEYAVLSFDTKRLPKYVAYVENQKAHHARAELIPLLERTGEANKKGRSDPPGDKSPG